MLAALFCFFKTDYPASYVFFLMSLEFQMIIGNTETGITFTLEFGIDVGQGITIGPGKFVKKNKRREQ